MQKTRAAELPQPGFLGFSRKGRQICTKNSFFRVPCLSLWERCLSGAKTERVRRERDGKRPLSRLRRQLSQRESQGSVRIRTTQQILMAPSFDRMYSKATTNKSDAILTGGAYQRAVMVALRHTLRVPTRSFLPCLFSCERKDRASGGTRLFHDRLRLLLAVLACVELVIGAPGGHEGAVRAAFDDLAVVDDEDHIRAADGRQTVGDDE